MSRLPVVFLQCSDQLPVAAINILTEICRSVVVGPGCEIQNVHGNRFFQYDGPGPAVVDLLIKPPGIPVGIILQEKAGKIADIVYPDAS